MITKQMHLLRLLNLLVHPDRKGSRFARVYTAMSTAEFLSHHMLPICFDRQDDSEVYEMILYNRKGPKKT